MKWRDLYLSLSFEVPLGEGSIASAFLERLAHGASFPARFCVFSGTERDPEPIFTDELFGIIIMEILPIQQKPEVQISFMTIGRLPPGVNHGTFSLPFSPDGFTSLHPMPRALFLDEEAQIERIPELRWSELSEQ